MVYRHTKVLEDFGSDVDGSGLRFRGRLTKLYKTLSLLHHPPANT